MLSSLFYIWRDWFFLPSVRLGVNLYYLFWPAGILFDPVGWLGIPELLGVQRPYYADAKKPAPSEKNDQKQAEQTSHEDPPAYEDIQGQKCSEGIKKSPSDFQNGNYTVPTEFLWRRGGNEVFVTGTFDDWKKTLKMAKSSAGNQVVHYACPSIDRSRPQLFKFVVDGEWRCDPDLPIVRDEGGNENHQLPKMEM
ncbi:uncharacterized protein VTP21DRAFT_9924 [Calcarisporiella thermophila]|uniref:uncharacterized protein n=1 Tax=Calcarisporiella thermophila TaxID=911321 RepID=UPI00374391A7